MCSSVQSWIENSLADPHAIGLYHTWADPSQGKTFDKWQKMNLPPAVGTHFGEVGIRQNEIHLQARTPTARVAMPLQCRAQASQIVRSLQRVEIIRPLAESEAPRAQLVPSFLISHPRSTPIVALE